MIAEAGFLLHDLVKPMKYLSAGPVIDMSWCLLASDLVAKAEMEYMDPRLLNVIFDVNALLTTNADENDSIT